MTEIIPEPEAPTVDLEDLFADEEPETPAPLETLTEDELRARLTAAEKKAAFEREQRVAASKRAWAKEAKEHFPDSDPDTIQADSRRAFLEAAKARQDKANEIKAPLIAKLEADREQMEAEIRAKLEQEAREAWGAPTVGGTPGPVDVDETEQRLSSARGRKDLVGVAKALMDGRRI